MLVVYKGKYDNLNVWKKPMKEDIERNLLLLEEDKPLDMPLLLLNGKFKEKWFKKRHKSDNIIQKIEKRQKDRVIKN